MLCVVIVLLANTKENEQTKCNEKNIIDLLVNTNRSSSVVVLFLFHFLNK